MTVEPRPDLANLERAALESALEARGHQRFHARQIFRWIYQRGVTDIDAMTDLSRDLRAYAMSTQRVVSGDVRIRLDHGTASVTGRRSPLSLYDKDLATYDEGDAFDHAAAVGFIEIFGLPLRVEAARHGAVGKHHGAAWTWTQPLLADLPSTVTEGAGAAAG